MGADVLRTEIFAKFELGASYQVFVLKSPHYAKPQNVSGHYKKIRNMLHSAFFAELVANTEKQFQKSSVYKKQLSLGKEWNYSICATPISKENGVLLGINWGGNDGQPQTEMPSGNDISEYHFIKQSKKYLEDYWGLNIASINFNYTNLCFFRTPNEKDLSITDYQNSLPLFEQYIRYINPKWILSIGGNNIRILNQFGLLRNIKEHFDNQNKFKGYSAQIWDWNIFSVPHPGAHLTTEARKTIWMKVSAEMLKTTNP